MLREIIEDTSALGGIAVFLSAIFIAFFTDNKILALKLFIGLILCYAVVIGIRIFYFKQRPDKQKYKTFLGKLDASSFPSLHAMSSIYVAIVLANHIKKSIISIFLVSISLLIAYSRIYLKKHYFVDIMLGLILGIIASIIYLLIINFS